MNIFKEIFLKSRKSSKKIFLDKKYKYSDLYNLTKEYLSFFRSNLNQGEIVSVILPYSIDFISIILSARMNGNPLCFLSPNFTEFEKKNILKQSNYSMIISDKKFGKKNQKYKKFYFKIRKNKKKLKKKDAFIIFTSGTTSSPKGVILPDRSIKKNVEGIIDQLKFNSKDRTIIYSPPNYAMGVSQVITFLYLKCSFLFDNNGIKFVNDFLNKIKKYKITILNLNIASFRYIKIFRKKFMVPSLRIVMSGGMKMNYIDALEIFNFFGNKFTVNFYGCTENSPRVSHFKFSKGDLKKFKDSSSLPVGKPILGTKIFIKSSKKIDVKKKGEIVLSGNSMMSGYLNVRKSEKKIINFNTKDIGYFSKDKNLFIIGRLDNVFKSGNEKVSPEEIEDKIRHFLSDRTFIVIKKKHPILEWKPVLVIEGKKKASDYKILNKLNVKLSNFKLPKEIFYLKNFYRNFYGKIDRNKIFKDLINYAN